MTVSNDASSPGADMDHPDPNGDVVLVVSPPKQPRAYNRLENTVSNKQVSALGGQNNPFSLGTQGSTFGSQQNMFSFNSQGAGFGQQSNTANKQETKPPTTRRFKVSSRHLSLASKYFEGRLRPCWSEGETLQNKGTVELDITDTDPEALLILLNIIHGRIRRVPRAVRLSQLTELAVLVDYLQCHEAVDLFANLWVDALRREVPCIYYDDLIKWIFISWVFRDAEIFRRTTRAAQRMAFAELSTLELPIPAAVKSNIDKSRTDALEAVILALFSRVESLKESNNLCNFYCDSMQLGALLRQMRTKSLDPRQSSPFPGIWFNHVERSISEFVSPKCLNITALNPSYSTGPLHNSIVGQRVQDEVDRTTRSLNGLDLQEYP